MYVKNIFHISYVIFHERKIKPIKSQISLLCYRDSTRPDKPITHSDQDGDYVINNVCTTITYVFSLDGYLPEEKMGTSGTGVNVNIQSARKLN